MKTYRCGGINDVIGFLGWGIQEKKWYGWRTLIIYSDYDRYKNKVEELKKKENVIVL